MHDWAVFATSETDAPCKCGGKQKRKSILASFDDQLTAEDFIWNYTLNTPNVKLSVGPSGGWEPNEVRLVDC